MRNKILVKLLIKNLKKLSILFFLLIAISCIYPKITIKGKGNIKLIQTDFSDLENWQQTDYRTSLISFIHSCRRLAKMPQSRLVGGQIGDITAVDFRDICEIADVVKGMSDNQIKNFFENWFKPFQVSSRNGDKKGLFTGYYEASLRGSKIKTEQYKYPIYAKPKDLTLDPYLSRAEIEAGALENKGLELLYVDDKAELFFMHVQGSGRVTLPNGSVVRLSFAAKNNQPYTSISNYFADNNLIARDKISADTIKDWLRANPEKSDEAMNINAAFIFFKLSDSEYVVGAQGAPLTAEHSLAVDNEIIPYGLPIWIETSFKNKDGKKQKYNQLLIAQDTGSAIRGVVRGDIFFGYGKEAESKASTMASSGEYYILLPNNIADKISGNINKLR